MSRPTPRARLGSHRILALVLALTLTAATTAVVAAVVTSNPGPFTGCLADKNTAKGTLYNIAIGSAPTAACPKGDAQVTFSNAQGPIGPIGPQGLQGEPGTNGTNGTDGINGTNGTNGTDGTNGAPGAAGTSDVYVATKGPAVTGVGNLLSVSVPAGSYLVIAEAALLNQDADPQTATCSRVGGFSTSIRLGGIGDGAVFMNVAVFDTVTLASSGTITIECHGFAMASGEAKLTATKVTAIH